MASVNCILRTRKGKLASFNSQMQQSVTLATGPLCGFFGAAVVVAFDEPAAATEDEAVAAPAADVDGASSTAVGAPPSARSCARAAVL